MIGVITHKKYVFPQLDSIYKVICVGDELEDYALDNNYFSANSKENTIYNSPVFSELRGLYYEYSHIDYEETDNIFGLCHYRRYFICKDEKIINQQNIEEILKEYDIILPKPIVFKHSIYSTVLKATMYAKDLKILQQVIKKRCPEYEATYLKFMSQKNMVYANMFISGCSLGKEYCKWLFDILFDVKNSLDMSGYTFQEQRVLGYMGEILINVFCINNHLKIKYLNIVNIEKTSGSRAWKLKSSIKNIIKHVVFFPNGIPYRRR